MKRSLPRWALPSILLGLGLTLRGTLTSVQAEPPPAPQRTRVVILHKPGPKWPESGLRFDAPIVQAHAAYYGSLFQKGLLERGGPFLSGGSGGIMVFAPAVSKEDAQAKAEEDPAVVAGVIAFEVRTWLQVFGG